MATGLKDDSIARVLKVSRRTVQKHVTDAGNALGAKTRFQIALRAGAGVAGAGPWGRQLRPAGSVVRKRASLSEGALVGRR